MKKYILLIIVSFLTLGLLTGCSNKKEMITADEFYNRIGSNYTLVDVSNQLDYVKKAYMYSSDGISFYFYEGNRVFDMGNIYIDEVNNAASALFNKQDEIDKGDNYSSIKIWNDETYYRIAYVDNTLLFIKAIDAYKAKADDIVEKCGY